MTSPESNPLEPSQSDASMAETVPRATFGRWGAILLTVSTLVTGCGIYMAVTLIPQAIERSRSARQEENVAVKAEHETVARNSLVLGMTAVVCTLIALLTFVFPFVGRHDVAAVLLGSCVASFGLITLIFKPF